MLIDILQLEQVAKKVSKEGSEIRLNADQMNKVSEGIETGWKSQYTTAYLEELEKVQKNIYKVSNNLQRIAQTMNEIIVETRRVEDQNKERMRFNR